MTDRYIHSFIEYWEAVKELMLDGENEMLFFRGQSNADYLNAEPGICHLSGTTENDEYHQIMVDYPEEFQKNDHISNLVKMQHFGCSTRLLDFTLNPLIGLFFATEADPDRNGKVFVAKVQRDKVLYYDSDKAIMLSCLPKFSQKDRDELRTFCENHPGRITDQDIIDPNSAMNRFLHEIRAELPAFRTEIIGKDLLQYYFLCPKKDNERMKVQEGAFAIFGLDEHRLVNRLNEELVVFEIAADAKHKILADLDLMRINTSTLFPGVERRAMQNRRRTTRWAKMI